MGRADGRLDSARVRAVGNALRMKRKRTRLDALARFVVAFNVIEHFIRVEVGVVVGNHNRLRMKVKRSWTKRTNYEVVRFECLMRRRRHVMLGHDWAEVIDVEAVGVVAAIPTDDVQRVVAVGVRVHLIATLDAHLKRALFVDGHRHFGQSQVALAVGRVLEELRRLLRHVARRRQDVRTVHALDEQEARLRRACLWSIEHHAIDGALGDHDVILGSKFQRAKHRVHKASTEVDEEALVGAGILEVVLHAFGGYAHTDLDIVVAKQHRATSDGIAFGGHRHAAHMAHAHGVALHILHLGRVQRLPSDHLRRRVDVIERRGRPRETFGAENFFGIEPSIRTTKLNVALRRELAELGVEGHCGESPCADVPRITAY